MLLEDSKKIKIGMDLRISSNIGKSEDYYGWSSLKTKMAGTIQTVSKIKEDGHRIYMKNPKNAGVSFHPDDLSFLTDSETEAMKSQKEPVLFDPNQLNIEVN